MLFENTKFENSIYLYENIKNNYKRDDNTIAFTNCDLRDITFLKKIGSDSIKSISFIDCNLNNVLIDSLESSNDVSFYFINCNIDVLKIIHVKRGTVGFSSCKLSRLYIYDCEFKEIEFSDTVFYNPQNSYYWCNGIIEETFSSSMKFIDCYIPNLIVENCLSDNVLISRSVIRNRVSFRGESMDNITDILKIDKSSINCQPFVTPIYSFGPVGKNSETIYYFPEKNKVIMYGNDDMELSDLDSDDDDIKKAAYRAFTTLDGSYKPEVVEVEVEKRKDEKTDEDDIDNICDGYDGYGYELKKPTSAIFEEMNKYKR